MAEVRQAGIGQFKLLDRRPDVSAEWEAGENRLRDMLGDVSILRDRRHGVTTPLPLSVLRSQADDTIDMFDIGGCGCAVGSIEEDAETLAALETS